MRIAVFTYGFPEKPDGNYTPAVIEMLCGIARFHDVFVFSVGGGRPAHRCKYEFENLTVIATGKLRSVSILFELVFIVREFFKLHNAQPFKLVHGIWHVGSLTATLFGRSIKKPIVLSMMGGEIVHLKTIDYGVISRAKWRWILRQCMKMADVITVGSEYYLKKVKAFYPEGESKLKLASLGIDPSKLILREKSDSERIQALCISSLHPVKNTEEIIKLVATFKEKNIDWTIAGDGPQREILEQQVKELHLEHRVRFSGWCASTHFRQQIGSYDLLISASSHEAQGMGLIEAAASGLPILSTRVGAAEVLQALGAAIELVDAIEDLPDVFAKMLELLPEKKRQALAAAKKIIDCYHIKAANRRFLSIYKKASTAKLEKSSPWYAVPLPLYMRLLRSLRALVFAFAAPIIMHIRKKNADTKVGGLTLYTQLDVFHPKFFFSGRILGSYLCSKHIGRHSVLDMGTGSGIVGIMAAQKGASVTAIDINPAAVALARRNAELHKLNGKMHCLESDLFAELGSEKFDWIVFNPPYLDGVAKSHESAAWYAGADYSTIDRFLQAAPKFLAKNGRIVLIFSSDMPLSKMDEKFKKFGYLVDAHCVYKHLFELFHVVELKPVMQKFYEILPEKISEELAV